jgi:serine/threonine protein kinase
MVLEGVKHAYEVVLADGRRPLAATKSYRLYMARIAGTDNWCLLQIARERKFNGELSRAAVVLDELADTSRRYDEAYGKLHEGKHLHYDRLFPEKVESFVSEDQGGRRVNVLSFTDVSDVRSLVPLSNLRTKDRVILDLKTGAWVMGRLLKLLQFAHGQGIAVRSLRSNNILLDREQHFAIVLDWTDAFMFQDKVSSEASTADIIRAAEAVLESCGVTSDGLPYALDDSDTQYVALIRSFAEGCESSADAAHTQFYQLVHDVWGTGFQQFTTLPLP